MIAQQTNQTTHDRELGRRKRERAEADAMCLAEPAEPVDLQDSVSGFRFVHGNPRMGEVVVASSYQVPVDLDDDGKPDATASVVVSYDDADRNGTFSPGERAIGYVASVSVPRGRRLRWTWPEKQARKAVETVARWLLRA